MTMITRYDDINLTKEQNDCVNYNAGNLLKSPIIPPTAPCPSAAAPLPPYLRRATVLPAIK